MRTKLTMPAVVASGFALLLLVCIIAFWFLDAEPGTAPLTDIKPDADSASDTAAVPVVTQKTAATRQVFSVQKGDTLEDILAHTGLPASESHYAIEALRAVFDPRQLQIGDSVSLLILPKADATNTLAEISLVMEKSGHVVVRRLEEDRFTAFKVVSDEIEFLQSAADPELLEYWKGEVRAGDTLINLLVNAGASYNEADSVTRIIAEHYDTRSMQIGQKIDIAFRSVNGKKRFAELILETADNEFIVVTQPTPDTYAVSRRDSNRGELAALSSPVTTETLVSLSREIVSQTGMAVIRGMADRGDTLIGLITGTGVVESEADAVLAALEANFDPRKLQIGQQLLVLHVPDPAGTGTLVTGLVILVIEGGTYVMAERVKDGEGFRGQRASDSDAIVHTAMQLLRPREDGNDTRDTAANAEQLDESPDIAASGEATSEDPDTFGSTERASIDTDLPVTAIPSRSGRGKIRNDGEPDTAGQSETAGRDVSTGDVKVVTVKSFSRSDLRNLVHALVADEDEAKLLVSEVEASMETRPESRETSLSIQFTETAETMSPSQFLLRESNGHEPFLILKRGADLQFLLHDATTNPDGPVHEVALADLLVFEPRTIELARNDTLVNALTKLKIDRVQAATAIDAMREHVDPRKMRAGQAIDVYLHQESLLGLVLSPRPGFHVEVFRNEHGFSSVRIDTPLHLEYRVAVGQITSSIYSAALNAGVPHGIVVKMIRAFSFDVDFQREIRRGDRFEVLYEMFVDEFGTSVRSGEPIYMSLEVSGTELPAYRFATGDGRFDYFNDDGESVRKALLRTPVDGARITSNYGMRTLFGFTRMHKGVDFGVPSGTPIAAAGDGVVDAIGWRNGYGNYIRLRHNSTYSTAYAHMKGFASNMKKGTRVSQGQTIGYVGSTGRSTGPHLHYEVLVDGKQINPMDLRLPSGETLEGERLRQFQDERARIDSIFIHHMNVHSAVLDRTESVQQTQ